MFLGLSPMIDPGLYLAYAHVGFRPASMTEVGLPLNILLLIYLCWAHWNHWATRQKREKARRIWWVACVGVVAGFCGRSLPISIQPPKLRSLLRLGGGRISVSGHLQWDSESEKVKFLAQLSWKLFGIDSFPQFLHRNPGLDLLDGTWGNSTLTRLSLKVSLLRSFMRLLT